MPVRLSRHPKRSLEKGPRQSPTKIACRSQRERVFERQIVLNCRPISLPTGQMPESRLCSKQEKSSNLRSPLLADRFVSGGHLGELLRLLGIADFGVHARQVAVGNG
jgi:hypothetical protein